MSELKPSGRGTVFDHASGEWRRQSAPAAYRSAPEGPAAGLMLVGVAALALGAWALYHFGPDLRRYIKMERM